MSKIFFAAGISIDGFLAGPNGGPSNPLGDGGTKIHEWMYRQDTFLKQIGLEGSGEKGADNMLIDGIMNRCGAYIIGKRMFDEGEFNWPEDSPFRCPVFVLTHHKRDPWVRKGGTTFYFVNGGLPDALEKAKAAADGKDIRIGGGANLIQQALNAGIVDEFMIHQASLFMGKGIRLFENINAEKLNTELKKVIPSNGVTHFFYSVSR